MGQQSSSGVLHHMVAAARAQLDDLMAELEAGARFVDRIERSVEALDGHLASNRQNRDEMAQLARRLSELRASVRQQRTLMVQLRTCFDTLRREMAGRF